MILVSWTASQEGILQERQKKFKEMADVIVFLKQIHQLGERVIGPPIIEDIFDVV